VNARDFLTRFEGLRDALPGDRSARAAAAEAFRVLGLPGAERGRAPEAWKYTSLRGLADLPPTGEAETTTHRADGAKASFLSRFADAPDFGPLARPDRDPLAALNTMLAQDGVTIDIPAGADAGAMTLANHTRAGTSTHPRHTIRLGAGARLTLLETATSDAACLHNPLTTILLGPGARLTHTRLQDEHPEAFHLATICVRLDAGAVYDGFTLNMGARLNRTEYQATLSGPDATLHLNGAQLLDGARHSDFTSVIRHAEPRGVSRQTVKTVLAGRARGVFQGRIEVARGAQKTDGYQMNRALLLSPDAEIDAKPELEIFADDVKCSHGATVGELDAEALFYLHSRGIGEAEARAMLVRAFLDEALAFIADPASRTRLDTAVQAWWDRQTGYVS
jgi:Fe-S cluster assembly protein SufD